MTVSKNLNHIIPLPEPIEYDKGDHHSTIDFNVISVTHYAILDKLRLYNMLFENPGSVPSSTFSENNIGGWYPDRPIYYYLDKILNSIVTDIAYHGIPVSSTPSKESESICPGFIAARICQIKLSHEIILNWLKIDANLDKAKDLQHYSKVLKYDLLKAKFKVLDLLPNKYPSISDFKKTNESQYLEWRDTKKAIDNFSKDQKFYMWMVFKTCNSFLDSVNIKSIYYLNQALKFIRNQSKVKLPSQGDKRKLERRESKLARDNFDKSRLLAAISDNPGASNVMLGKILTVSEGTIRNWKIKYYPLLLNS